MQQGSKHGPALDDELSKEPVEVDDLPQFDADTGTPEGMSHRDLDDRAALAALLGKEIWPAMGEFVQRRVAESLGPDKLRQLVTRLQKHKAYASLGEVWAEIADEPLERRF